MHFFIDEKKRRWEFTINVPALKRVRELLKLDLTQLFEDDCKPMAALSTNFELQVDAMYVLCEDQCQSKSVTDIEFGSSLGGDVLEKAWFALLQAVIDFFPSESQRNLARKMVEKAIELTNSMTDSHLTRLNALSGNWQDFVAQTQASAPGDS